MRTIPLFIFSLLLPAFLCDAQEFTDAGWFRSTAKSFTCEIPAQQSGQSGGVGPLSLVTAPEIAEATTPQIQALARGLENDPKQIFDYVHDNIRYVHYFGSKKGAQLTLLERSGNDFDQCALLVALLRAAGLTANYRFALVYMPYESSFNDGWDFQHCVGLTKPATNVDEALNFAITLNEYRGFPYATAFFDGTSDLLFHHVWVKLSLNGDTYDLDPAFKLYQPVAGINLATAMGLDTNQLMTAAGGTSTADYAQSLSETGVRNKLRDYTTNFLGYLQNNSPNASVEEILGGPQIVSSVYDSFGGLSFGEWGYGLDWTSIPTNLMTTLNMVVDGTSRFVWFPQLQGGKLA